MKLWCALLAAGAMSAQTGIRQQPRRIFPPEIVARPEPARAASPKLTMIEIPGSRGARIVRGRPQPLRFPDHVVPQFRPAPKR